MADARAQELELVARAAARDERALRAVLDRAAARLRATAWHLCHDHHEAQDLLQEALLHLSRADVLRAFRGDGPLDGYLMSAGVRRMLSARRTRPFRGLRDVELYGDADERLAGGEPADGIVEATLHPRLAAALASLPERARTVVVLLAVGELEYEECARALGMPIGTVRSTYSRARAVLRAQLGEAHHGTA